MKGGIAQLVERLLCKQDVSGSNPLTSTKKTQKKTFGLNKEIKNSALSPIAFKQVSESAGL